MPMIDGKEWVSSGQAALYLSQRTGKKVSARYIRKLVARGELTALYVTPRTNLYSMDELTVFEPSERVGKPAPAKKGSDGA